MISFGDLWLSTMRRYLEVEKRGLRETARLLKVDPNTIKRKMVSHVEPSKETHGKRSSYSIEEWIKLEEENPGCNKKDLRAKRPELYAWLYRHHKEWLLERSGISQEKNKSTRKDWAMVDMTVANKIRCLQGKFFEGRERKTVSGIGKKIGQLALLQKHLEKLPLTRQAIDDLLNL